MKRLLAAMAASVLTFGLAPGLPSSPAAAQSTNSTAALSSAEMVGEWRTANGSLRLGLRDSATGELYAYGLATSSGGELYEMSAFLKPTGFELVGDWEHLNGNFQGGEWRLRLLGDDLIMEGFFAGGRTHEFRFSRVRQDAPSTPQEPGRPTTPVEPTPPVEPTTPSRPQPAPPRPAPPVEEAEGDAFRPLGAWSVRVDRVENPSDDRLTHIYLTLRNDSSRRLVQTEGVSVLHENSEGLVVESGQGLKAQPGYPELFGSPPPIVLPGREIQTKFVFDRNGETVSVTVQEGPDRSATFDF